MFASLTKKPLWLNLLIAIGIVAAVALIFFGSLDFFTRHGEMITIPAVTGKSFTEAKSLLESKGFEVVIQDSVYRDSIAAQAVVKQFPDAESSVKVNRTVYLTVNRTVPPDVVMPNLVGMSLRNAGIILRQFNLKMGDTSYKPDFAKNSVLNQQAHGKEVKPGTKLPMGTPISLVLGSGLADIDMAVPDLFGMTFAQASSLLSSAGINFGAKVMDPDVKDTSNAFIYRQSPERNTPDYRVNRIRAGQMIDIWLGAQKPQRDTSRAGGGGPVENNY